MASSNPREDGPQETGFEAGASAQTPQYDRRKFFRTLGIGAGAATVYGLGAGQADGQITEATEADMQALIEEEPYPDLSPEEFAEKLQKEAETDAQLVQQFLNVNNAQQQEFLESLSAKDRTALFAALPMLFVPAPEENVEHAQGSTRRKFLAAGVTGLAALGLAGSAQAAEKKSLLRTVAANNTSGRRTERAPRLTPEQQYKADLRAKLTALAATNPNISSVDIAMTYHDYDSARRDFETPDQARERRRAAITDFNVIHNREDSTRMVEVEGQQVQLPTRHTQWQRKQEQAVRVGNRTVMGKMNYIIADTYLLTDPDTNPMGLKISKPLSMDADMAERRFQAYKSRY